ncbi:MAG: hypothetical protein KatS3mg105_4027 [Gemmatales bacterium]|nr:MAG: hypothetical protein KatS3mg105_4027 [Gemmatales bacterium]
MEEIIRHAQAEFPLECCGLLAGTIDGKLGVVTKRYPLRNAEQSPTRFFADEKALLQAVKDMRANSTEVLAIYHSHPTTAPFPSLTDLRSHGWPTAVALIVSLKDHPPEVRGWWLERDHYRGADWAII